MNTSFDSAGIGYAYESCEEDNKEGNEGLVKQEEDANISESGRTCNSCGTLQIADKKYCVQCGEQVADKERELADEAE